MREAVKTRLYSGLFFCCLALLIGGAIVGDRHLKFSQVTCIAQYWPNDSRDPPNRADGEFCEHELYDRPCIKWINSDTGVGGMGKLETYSDLPARFPATCWAKNINGANNGENSVTFDDPDLVLQYFFIILGCLLLLWSVCVFCFFRHFPNLPSQSSQSTSSTINSESETLSLPPDSASAV